MSAVTASLVLGGEDLIGVRVHDEAGVVGAVEVAGMLITTFDPDAFDDLATALSEASARMRIMQRAERAA